MSRELFSYLKEHWARDICALFPSLVTASAYGTIYNAQFESFLKNFGLSLDKIPAWFRVPVLSLIMGSNNFALNFTKNREHWERIRYLYRTGQLRQTIYNRFKNHPLEMIIASLGGGAELLIVLFSAYQLLDGQSKLRSATLSYAIFSAVFSGFQYATVDGESLNEAVMEGLPKLDADLALKKRNHFAMALTYKISLIGAINMGLLAAISAEQVLRQSFGGDRLNDAYYFLASILIASNYAGLDFTLYGRELVARALTRLKTGSWEFPALNTKMRKIKLILAIIGSLLMAIVGFSALKDTFYYKKEAPWWAYLLFTFPAFITGLQIFNTEGIRFIELTGKVQTAVEDLELAAINDLTERAYNLAHFVIDCIRTGLSLGAGSLTYSVLTTGFQLPQNIYTLSGSLISFTAINTVVHVSEKKLTTEPEPSLYQSISWSSIAYSIFMMLLASVAAFLWKRILMSHYDISETVADNQIGYIGLATATAVSFVEKPVTLIAKSLWNSLPNINFFTCSRDNESTAQPNERSPLVLASTNSLNL